MICERCCGTGLITNDKRNAHYFRPCEYCGGERIISCCEGAERFGQAPETEQITQQSQDMRQ